MARFAFGNRKVRKLSGEFFEPERAALGDRERIRERERIGVEQSRAICSGVLSTYSAFGRNSVPAVAKRRFVLHAGEHVAQARVLAIDVGDAVGRDVRHVEPLRERDQRLHERAVFGP